MDKTTKVIIYVMMMVIASSLVYAGNNTEHTWFKFDGDLTNSGTGPTTLAINGTAVYNTTSYISGTAAFEFTGTNYIELLNYNFGFAVNKTKNFSINYWQLQTSATGGTYIFAFGSGGGNSFAMAVEGGVSTQKMVLNGDYRTALRGNIFSVYSMFTITHNTSEGIYRFYTNNTYIGNYTDNVGIDGTGRSHFGFRFNDPTSKLQQKMDDFRFYEDYILNSSDITWLYNSGSGRATSLNTTIETPSSPGTFPTVININPTNGDNDVFTTLNFTFSYADTEGNNSNCTLFINNSRYGNVTTSGDKNYNITNSPALTANADYSWKVGCQELGTTNYSNSTAFTYTIDSTNPTPTITSISSGTRYYRDASTALVNATCSDANLYQMSINITNATGKTQYYKEWLDLNATSNAYNETVAISTWAYNHTYTMNLSCSDDHTASKFNPHATILNLGSKKKFIFDGTDEIDIEITNIMNVKENPVNLMTFIETKLDDRYTFSASFNKVVDYFDMVITADKIVYRPNSAYPGHIIINDKYWYDIAPYNVELIYYTSQQVKFRVFVGSNTFNSQSLGGLNFESTTTSFEKISAYTPCSSCSYSTYNTSGNNLLQGLPRWITFFNSTIDIASVGTIQNVTVKFNDTTLAYATELNATVAMNFVDLGVARTDAIHGACLFPSGRNCDLTLNITWVGSGYVNISYRNMSWYPYEINYTPSLYVYEPTTWTIFLNINTTENSSAYLTYNKTVYNATKTAIPASYLHRWVVTMPVPNTLLDNDVIEYINHSWTYSINYSNGTKIMNNATLNYTQTIFNYLIDNCSYDKNYTLRVDIYDEVNPTTRIDANLLEGYIFYWKVDQNYGKNYSFNVSTTTNYTICLYPGNETIYADAYFKYNVSSGLTHRYYIQNGTLTNTQQNHSLYNSPIDIFSDLNGEVRQKTTYALLPDVLVKLYKYYVGENTWRIVQMDKSDDYGKIHFDVTEISQDYRLYFYDGNNNILRQTDNMKFICTSGICDVAFLVDPYSSSTSKNLSVSASYDNDTEIIEVTWSDPTGVTKSVNVIVSTIGNRKTIICNQTQALSDGFIECDTTGYSGTMFVEVYSSASPFEDVFNWIVEKIKLFNFENVGSVDKQETLLWNIVFLMALGFSALYSPIAVLIMAVFSMIVSFVFGLGNVWSISSIIITTIITIFLAMKMGQRPQQ